MAKKTIFDYVQDESFEKRERSTLVRKIVALKQVGNKQVLDFKDPGPGNEPKVTLEEKFLDEFLSYCKKYDIDFDIYIIPPIGKFRKYKDNIFLFPLSFDPAFGLGDTKIWFMRHTVLFKGKIYDHEDVFHDNELVNTAKMLAFLAPEVLIRVPYSLIKVPSKEFMEVKKKCLTPLRNFLCNIDAVNRLSGKRDQDLIRDRYRLIRKEYREILREGIRKQDRIINRIKKALREHANRIIFSDNLKESKRIERVFNISNTTIWRTIQKFHKK